MTVNDSLVTPRLKPKSLTNIFPWLKLSSRPLKLLLLLLASLLLGAFISNQNEQDQQQSIAIIAKPHLNDIYFLDFRLQSNKLRPDEKYRIAKVVDITGDIVTLLYGSFYYPHQNAAKNAIRYGHLRFRDYFQPKRYNLSSTELKAMFTQGSIYLAKRPKLKRLYGNFVGIDKIIINSTHYTPGKRENIAAQSLLNNINSQPYNELFQENNLQSAFELLQRSANYGYAQGQTNLAKMYINGLYAQKDLTKALFWLNQASLQSYKPAIYKYAIVCHQVSSCQLYDFYKGLTMAGVNIKVRNLDFSLSKSTN